MSDSWGVDLDTYDVSSLKAVVHAAAPCPVPVKEQIIEWWGPIVHEYYAGSEGNGFVYCNSEMWLAHEGTVGTPINCTVHIVGEDGEEVPAGQEGTIYFSDTYNSRIRKIDTRGNVSTIAGTAAAVRNTSGSAARPVRLPPSKTGSAE